MEQLIKLLAEVKTYNFEYLGFEYDGSILQNKRLLQFSSIQMVANL